MRLPPAHVRHARAHLGGIATALHQWSRKRTLERLVSRMESARSVSVMLDRSARVIDVLTTFERYRAELFAARVKRANGGIHPDEKWRRCGAKTRAGSACSSRPVWGRRRCRMHGGSSTGPKTAEGRARALANLRRGTAE